MVVGSDYWHTSEAAKSKQGQKQILDIAKTLSSQVTAVCWLYEPLERSDREGEMARAQSLRFAVTSLLRKHLPSAGLLVYEQRRPGYQVNSDLRVFSELRNSKKLDRDFFSSF